MPSGASTGEREALELRDGDKTRYRRQGRAEGRRERQRRDRQALAGRAFDQRSLDEAMIALDGTPTKSRLGRQRAARRLDGGARAPRRPARRMPLYRHIGALVPATTGAHTLPVPMMNILNGGAHADSSVDFQEFMVMPVGAAVVRRGAANGAEIFHALRGILKEPGHSTGVGDEGGFAPNLKVEREAVDVVLEAIGRRATSRASDVFIALDVAASELWDEARPLRVQEVGRADAHSATRWSSSTRLGRASTRSSRSKTASPKATGTAGSG